MTEQEFSKYGGILLRVKFNVLSTDIFSTRT